MNKQQNNQSVSDFTARTHETREDAFEPDVELIGLYHNLQQYLRAVLSDSGAPKSENR